MDTNLLTWKKEYSQLLIDLLEIQVGYTYGSGRKFYLNSSPKEALCLSDLENKVVALFDRGIKAISSSGLNIRLTLGTSYQCGLQDPAHFSTHYSLLHINALDLNLMQENLKSMSRFKEQFADQIAKLDVNIDRSFYAEKKPSLCFRIVLFIYRLFGNWFKTPHADFPALFEKKSEESDLDFYDEKLTLCQAQLAVLAINRIWTLQRQEDQSPQVLKEIEDCETLLNQLIEQMKDEREDQNSYFGVNLTHGEVNYLLEMEDASSVLLSNPSITSVKSILKPDASLQQLEELVPDLFKLYNPFDETVIDAYGPKICARMSAITLKQYQSVREELGKGI